MVTFSEVFEMVIFSVMEFSFCCANVNFILVPATGLVDCFGHLGAV